MCMVRVVGSGECKGSVFASLWGAVLAAPLILRRSTSKACHEEANSSSSRRIPSRSAYVCIPSLFRINVNSILKIWKDCSDDAEDFRNGFSSLELV